MDRELQLYYETLLDMFSTEGWKTFVDDQDSALGHLTITAARDCPDNDAWQYRRGCIATLSKIVSFEEIIRSNYDSLERDIEIEAEWAEVVH